MGPKKILFIGAGASFGARERMLARPPLGNDLCRWLKDQAPRLAGNHRLIDLFSSIETAQEILGRFPNEQNYEYLLGKLNRDDRVALSRLLQISFTDLLKRDSSLDLGFRSVPDGYDQLLEHLKFDYSWAVISLNYDVLFEEALARRHLSYLYPHFPLHFKDTHVDKSDLYVYKPHGSINFFAHDHHIIYHGNEPRDPGEQMPTEFSYDENGMPVPNYPIWFAASPGAENVLGRAHSSATPQPVMANYTAGKPTDVNEKTLALVREEALELCRVAEEAVVIGVRPIADATDDPFVSAFFSIQYPKFRYVSPSSSDCERVRIFQKSGDILKEGLIAYLSQ